MAAFAPYSVLKKETEKPNLPKSKFQLNDDMTDVEGLSNLPIFWYKTTGSTMDTAKDLVNTPATKGGMFAVVTKTQTNGRGTRGRKWFSASNNLYMTVSIKRSDVKIPLNLLPLRVGTLVASAISPAVTSGFPVKLKWPNDILIKEEKICGILMESDGNYIHIGIGCNVMSLPDHDAMRNSQDLTTEDQPLRRPATCLAKHNAQLAEVAKELEDLSEFDSLQLNDGELEVPPSEDQTNPITTADFRKQLAIDIFRKFEKWLEFTSSNVDDDSHIVTDFENNMDFSNQFRRAAGVTDVGIEREVIPLHLNIDGTLQVKEKETGKEETLISDYLW